MITFDVQFNLDGLQVDVEKKADLYQRKASMELHTELVETTPVDTGRARAGWMLDAEKGDDLPEAVAPPEGWEKGDEAYYSAPSTPLAPQGKDYVMVYNNVEYIKPLNDGTSSQAARLFVDAALDKVKKGFK